MSSLKEKANVVIQDWEEYNLPNTCIEKFVFENLYNLDTKEYVLKEILNNKAIQVLIDNGVQIINAHRDSKRLFTLGSKSDVEFIPTSEQYEQLFSSWCKAGWISYENNNKHVNVAIKG